MGAERTVEQFLFVRRNSFYYYIYKYIYIYNNKHLTRIFLKQNCSTVRSFAHPFLPLFLTHSPIHSAPNEQLNSFTFFKTDEKPVPIRKIDPCRLGLVDSFPEKVDFPVGYWLLLTSI